MQKMDSEDRIGLEHEIERILDAPIVAPPSSQPEQRS
jgi:hypothetical protein